MQATAQKLYQSLKEQLSEQHHSRLSEILQTVDLAETYNISKATGYYTLKRKIQEAESAMPNCSVLYNDTITYNGVATFYPELKIYGDFIVLLVMSHQYDAVLREKRIKKSFIVLEKQSVNTSAFYLGG